LVPDTTTEFSVAAYRQLAEFRYAIRNFLHFSETAARQEGIEPQQHQLLLTIKGLPPDLRPTVTAISTRLCLKHHSTVELIDRMEQRGLVSRRPGDKDRRETLIDATEEGERLLQKLSILHWEELRKQAPALIEALKGIVE
jgi:DNA-binding MarR family transcriptional regulator